MRFAFGERVEEIAEPGGRGGLFSAVAGGEGGTFEGIVEALGWRG